MVKNSKKEKILNELNKRKKIKNIESKSNKKYRNAYPFIISELLRGPIKTKDIARELDCSIKTVQRYLNEMSIPFYLSLDKKSGTWFIEDNNFIKKLKLTAEEACLLVILEQNIKSIKNKKLEYSFNKFKSRFSNNVDDDIFYIKLPKSQEYKQTDLTQKLEQFIINKQYISMDYNQRTKKIWNLKPVKIAFFDGFWYLICIGKENNLVKFAINKIKSVSSTGETFIPPTDIKELLDKMDNIWSDPKKTINIKLKISKNIVSYFKEKIFFSEQKIEEETKDGDLIISCKMSIDQEVMSTIFQWIPNIKVLEPQSLADTIKQRVSEYLSKL